MTVAEAVKTLEEAVALGFSATLEVRQPEQAAPVVGKPLPTEPQVLLRISHPEGLSLQLTELMARKQLRVANSDVLLSD